MSSSSSRSALTLHSFVNQTSGRYDWISFYIDNFLFFFFFQSFLIFSAILSLFTFIWILNIYVFIIVIVIICILYMHVLLYGYWVCSSIIYRYEDKRISSLTCMMIGWFASSGCVNWYSCNLIPINLTTTKHIPGYPWWKNASTKYDYLLSVDFLRFIWDTAYII